MIKKHQHATDEMLLLDEECAAEKIMKLVEDLRSSAITQMAVAYKTQRLISKVKETCRSCNKKLTCDKNLSYKS